MSTKVYTAELDADGLTRLIAKLRAEVPFAVLERPDKVDFPSASEMIEATNWPVGRVFGERVELHWEQEGTTYQVRLASADETTPPPGFSEALVLERPEPEPVWYYLWGEDEMAIGGRLNYSRAIPGKGRGQLGVVEYRDGEGRLIFYRYVGLKREVEHGR
jgi:hypothetical protein